MGSEGGAIGVVGVGFLNSICIFLRSPILSSFPSPFLIFHQKLKQLRQLHPNVKTLVPQGFSALTSYTKATPATTPTTPYSGNLCAEYQCIVHIRLWRQQKRCRQERNGVGTGVVPGVGAGRTELPICTKGSAADSICSLHSIIDNFVPQNSSEQKAGREIQYFIRYYDVVLSFKW